MNVALMRNQLTEKQEFAYFRLHYVSIFKGASALLLNCSIFSPIVFLINLQFLAMLYIW